MYKLTRFFRIDSQSSKIIKIKPEVNLLSGSNKLIDVYNVSPIQILGHGSSAKERIENH